jgi:hypothetical protein
MFSNIFGHAISIVSSPLHEEAGPLYATKLAAVILIAAKSNEQCVLLLAVPRTQSRILILNSTFLTASLLNSHPLSIYRTLLPEATLSRYEPGLSALSITEFMIAWSYAFTSPTRCPPLQSN